MSLTELSVNIPTEHVANVFGQFDAYIKKIERTLNVTVVMRDGSMKLIGNEQQIKSASNVFMQLLELSKRGNVITEQNVNYALSLAADAKESAIVEIDKDCICHTINGKPVKPKTLGQKNYVDAIRNKMIVFGMEPAGTGKTYLAMAMAITAFKNEEVGRIILTRPAIEAGEAWFPSGRFAEQGRSVSASIIRCPLSDHGSGELPEEYGERADRGSSARLYARQNLR